MQQYVVDVIVSTPSPLLFPYGSRYGSARTAPEESTAKSSENKEKPLISGEISGDLVAGAGFEPTAFGL